MARSIKGEDAGSESGRVRDPSRTELKVYVYDLLSQLIPLSISAGDLELSRVLRALVERQAAGGLASAA